MKNIGQRVNTPHGIGTIKDKEYYSIQGDYRVGVLHDVFPADLPRMYKDDILYYFLREVVELEQEEINV